MSTRIGTTGLAGRIRARRRSLSMRLIDGLEPSPSPRSDRGGGDSLAQ